MWVGAHGQVGWFLARACKLEARDRRLVAIASMLPDLDGLSILAGHQAYFTAHHVWLHEVFAAAAITLGATLLAQRRLLVAPLALAGILLHIGSDGLGLLALMPLWPASRWVFWPNDECYWLAALSEVAVPALLIWAQIVLARRDGISALEVLPGRAEDWLRERWRDRARTK